MKYKILLAVLVTPMITWAWGGRGHHSICSAAVHLVKDETLRSFLKTRPHTMGHLCNIPDIYWKNLGGDINRLGSPTHYIDVEITGMKIGDVPTDYKKIVEKYTNHPNEVKKDRTIFSVPTEFGSLWWRADQFFRRASGLAKDFKKSTPPTNSKEEQDDNLPFNKTTYDFMVNLGIMGHFVGDASQPYHASVDYDGYMSGHGGIHSFYEDQGVAVLGPDLEARIVQAGEKLQEAATSKDKEVKKTASFLTAKSVVEKMRALSEISGSEVPLVVAADTLKKPSELKSEKGMEIKTPAERSDVAAIDKKFEPLIIQQMGRSAALLAQLWDEAYVKAGKPKLGAYRSYRYPFTPEFIPPDYFDDVTPPKK